MTRGWEGEEGWIAGETLVLFVAAAARGAKKLDVDSTSVRSAGDMVLVEIADGPDA